MKYPRHFIAAITAGIPANSEVHELIRKNDPKAFAMLSEMSMDTSSRETLAAFKAVQALRIGHSINQIHEQVKISAKLDAELEEINVKIREHSKEAPPFAELPTVELPEYREVFINNKLELAVLVKEADLPALQAHMGHIGYREKVKIVCEHYAYYVDAEDDESCWARIIIESRNPHTLSKAFAAVSSLLIPGETS